MEKVDKILQEWFEQFALENDIHKVDSDPNSLGIPGKDTFYQRVLNNQDLFEESYKTQEFFTYLKETYPEQFADSNIDFINYGDTQLVYVISKNTSYQTMLVNQPKQPIGTVKLEHDNLRKLASKYPDIIVCPTAYYQHKDREAYITPYFYQARCIASQYDGYGSYIPEPYYRFEKYSKREEYLITKVMIANLIRLYDKENKLAIAECKLGGGDFILEKEFDNEPHTEENILKRMHLIAARKLINIELKDYIELIKKEFSEKTYFSPNNYVINNKNRYPISEKAIEEGIRLGLKL